MTTLKSKVVSGLAWSGMAKLVAQLFSWVSTFVVIRYLNPNDYALLGLAFAFIGFFYVLSEFGLADALIQKKETSQNSYSQVFTATLLLNTIIFALIYSSSTLIAEFYHNSALNQVLIFVAANLLLSSFITIPETLMNKEMLFKKRALIETFSSALNTFVTLGLALYGFGYWSILIGQVANTLCRVILFNALGYNQYRITTDFYGFSSLFHFGAYTFLSRVVWALYNKLDVFIIGRVFGAQLLGIYTVALQLAAMPLDKISGTINQVAFSTFSQHQEDKNSQQHFFLTIRLLAVIVFPLFIGIATISPVLIPILIGDKWLESIVIIQLLSLMMPFKLISSFINTFIASKGEAKFNLKMSLLYLLFIAIGLLIGSFGNITNTVTALVIAYTLCFMLVSHLSLAKVNYSYIKFINSLWQPLICALLMCVGLLLLNYFFLLNINSMLYLVLMIVIGALIYLGCLFVFAKEHIESIKSLIKR